MSQNVMYWNGNPSIDFKNKKYVNVTLFSISTIVHLKLSNNASTKAETTKCSDSHLVSSCFINKVKA